MFVDIIANMLRDETTISHNERSITEGNDFRQVGGDNDDSVTGGRKSVDQRIDLGLSRHIDTLGRLVEEVDSRLASDPLGNDEFLLITAGKLSRGESGVRGSQ
jgi:hypothetical protein